MLSNIGIRSSSAKPFLLDQYPGSAAAYSLRRIGRASAYAIRVRRNNDNTEQDIGFLQSGALDESALTTFVGANWGYVVKIYDQSGSGRDAVSQSATSQAWIIENGTILKVNSKPSIYFNSTYYSEYLCNNFSTNVINTSTFSVFKRANSSGVAEIMFSSGSTSTGDGLSLNPRWTDDNIYATAGYIDNRVAAASSVTNNTSLVSIFGGTQQTAYYNGTLIGTGTTQSQTSLSYTNLYIGSGKGVSTANRFYTGYISELIIYNSINSSNRTGIETNINSFYSIY